MKKNEIFQLLLICFFSFSCRSNKSVIKQPTLLQGGIENIDTSLDIDESTLLREQEKSLVEWAKTNLSVRMEGQVLAEEPLKTSGIYFYYTPNRKITIQGEAPLNDPSDPLFKPSERGVLTYDWRGKYTLYPNNMPYVSRHILIIGDERQSQDFIYESSTINDLLDLQEVFPQNSFFFNHFAGNSIKHFHVHMTSSHLPLEFTLDQKEEKSFAYELDNSTSSGFIESLADNDGVKVNVFHHNSCQKGFLFEGENVKVSSEVTRFINYLKCNGFSFNMAIFPMDNDKHRVAIFVRWLGSKRVVNAVSEGVLPATVKVDLGSSELAGLMMVAYPVSLSETEASTKKPYLDLDALDETVLRACDLGVVDPVGLERFEKESCSDL